MSLDVGMLDWSGILDHKPPKCGIVDTLDDAWDSKGSIDVNIMILATWWSHHGLEYCGAAMASMATKLL